MKKAALQIILSLSLLVLPFYLSGQKADFRGTWKLDLSKVPVTGSFPVLKKISVNIKGDSLLTERFYDTGDGQIYPIKENLTLDGKEIANIVYDMQRKAKATWKEKDLTIIHEATTTAQTYEGPIDFKSTETWSVNSENNILTISFLNTFRSEESKGAFIFNRSEGVN
ncbi:MAG: hypothetical protein JXR66_04355 [Bacteroidales bacterium]|nr:hypothetical protein [Bacteroidales bacterium]